MILPTMEMTDTIKRARTTAALCPKENPLWQEAGHGVRTVRARGLSAPLLLAAILYTDFMSFFSNSLQNFHFSRFLFYHFPLSWREKRSYPFQLWYLLGFWVLILFFPNFTYSWMVPPKLTTLTITHTYPDGLQICIPKPYTFRP